MSQTQTPPAAPAAPTAPPIPPDPLVHKSYALPVWIAMGAVVATTVLACVDEMWMRRPYKAIQGQYQEAYSAYLEKVEAQRRDFYENVFLRVADYEALNKRVGEANAAVQDAVRDIQAQLTTATKQSRALGDALKVSKSELSALTYQAEHKAHEYGHAKVEESPESRAAIDEIGKVNAREIEYTYAVTTYVDGKEQTQDRTESGKVADLLAKALELEARKADLQTQLGKAGKPVADAAKAKEEWLATHAGDLQYALEKADDETRRRIAASGAARYLDESVVTLKPETIRALRAQVDEIPHSWNLFRGGASNFFQNVSQVPAFRGDLRQIHIKEAANWVDRCETCHLNARSPMPVTVESLRDVLGREVGDLPAWDKSKIESMPLGLFASHPNVELLRKHDPERFGCSMCHNGNGVAVTSTELAHGENHHWLQPLFPKENVEAGCVQCHQQDLVLAGGERITAGKDHFRRAGCWGCHKYEGFNREIDQITALEGRAKEIDAAVVEKQTRIENLRLLNAALDEDVPEQKAAKDRDLAANLRERQALQQEISGLLTESDRAEKRLRDAHVERQRVGPNLKDVRIKIRPEFLTDWINSPRDAHKDASGRPFRPETKMPTFRWANDQELRDVAYYLWFQSLDPAEFAAYKLPAFTPGDAAKGKDLFIQRGCVACHSIGIGADRVGNDYAANLSNLGEKDTPEYVRRWVEHPRLRLVPVEPKTGADVNDVKATPESRPDLVWTNPTIMPNFRLSDADARDITTYLVSQRRPDVKYPDPTWLARETDKAKHDARMGSGERLVLYQGCAGCHEIKGLEREKGIGTELTEEGSKPIERLDFGHLTIPAERGVEPLKGGEGLLDDAADLFKEDREWYRPRGFFLHKVAKPDVFDESKYLPDRFTRLRMPQFRFGKQDILDVVTFVLGSVKTSIPQGFRYAPDETGQAIRDGWWIVKKYNCQGCHQIVPGDRPSLWNVPYFGEQVAANKRDQFVPPTLVGVGFRVRPDYLAEFLRDPSLGGDRKEPTALRRHLSVRMPTFDFSDDEIAKLVRFFQALSGQPFVDQPAKLRRLDDKERRAANAMFKSANCQQCHVVEGQAITSETKAPNLSLAPKRLRPDWMRRWIPNPPAMIPDTAMTSFFGDKPGTTATKPEPSPEGKWYFKTPLPELAGVPEDHVELLVRWLTEGIDAK
jgi:cytochrome c2/cytochrome c1